jgi:hypothetical protein
MSTSMILGVAVTVFIFMLIGLFLTAREASKWDDPATHRNENE